MTTGDKLKHFFKRFWHLLWKDDSWKGWLLSIIVIFVFIKFIFFPILSLATGTDLPLAIVESCSMYHDGNLFSNFNDWFDRHEGKYASFTINKLDFQDFTMSNGFNKGDILFIVKANPDKLKDGDIIIFNAGQVNPIIHRIVDIKEVNGTRIFSTMGDNNNGQLTFEKRITENMVVGKAVTKIAPYFGWVKLVFFDWQKPVSERGLCHEN